MSKKANISQRIALSLKRHGIKEIFGQSNPPPLTLACIDIGIRQIGYRQENAGTYMTQAYGMVSGRVPVMTAQNGPAATLIVAGLAECLKASHPLVALVQEIGLDHLDRNAFQELDHIKLFEGVTKWVRKIPSESRIEDYIDMAFVAASSGRPGPVVLLCPSDMLVDQTEYTINENRNVSYGEYPLDRVGADPERIKEAAKLLAEAKRPLIYAGGGVISSGASKELREIQEKCSIPVASTTMGKGSVDEAHSLSMGPIGYYMGHRGSSKFMKPMIDEADVILLVGNRTNQNGTDGWTILPKGAKYIHIDIDPMEIGRNYEATVRIVADAKLALVALKDALTNEDLKTRKDARAALEKEISNAKEKHAEEASDVLTSTKSPVGIERILAELERQFEDNHIIVADASLSSVWLANYITATKERKFIFPRGLAGLGWGLPMAMGAKLASPKQKVFCLAGDGGFAHVWSELETCVRENINVVIAVINNEILGYQKKAETALMGRSTNACDLCPVDHKLIAEACGVKGIKVTEASQIESALKEAFAHNGPVLLDLMTDPNSVPPIPFMGVLEK